MPRNEAKMDPTKQLMIKVKACQRLVKEASYYVKETEENEATLKKMKEDNKDPYDIKKFQEVLGESQMMIPESKMRRDKAIESLREYVAQLKAEEAGNDAIWGCEWMTKAREMIGSDAGETDDVKETSVDGLKEGEAF